MKGKKKEIKLFKGWQVSKIIFNYFDYYVYYMISFLSVLKGQKEHIDIFKRHLEMILEFWRVLKFNNA
jgi:hypothetical protein